MRCPNPSAHIPALLTVRSGHKKHNLIVRERPGNHISVYCLDCGDFWFIEKDLGECQ
jgi:hypothetical protein